MYGRYGRRADKQRIAEWMQAHDTNVFDDSYFAPSFNVAPQTFQPVVRLNGDSGERELTVMRWGIVPFWSKDGKAAYSTINSKSETVSSSPAFREAWKRRRCLIPAEWFYEWKKLDEKTKQPSTALFGRLRVTARSFRDRRLDGSVPTTQVHHRCDGPGL
jgi:putative SOS response-associated peptidase YedK